MKRMMAIAAMLVACGGASEMDISEDHAAAGHSYNGKCMINPATGLENGSCIAQSPCGCAGNGTSPSCIVGRLATSMTLVCGTTSYGSNNNCKVLNFPCF